MHGHLNVKFSPVNMPEKVSPCWVFGYLIPLVISRLRLNEYLVQQLLWVFLFYNSGGCGF